MPEGRGRITVDLTPEMRRQLKSVAARVDMTMREFVTESVRRDLEAVQCAAAQNQDVLRQVRRAFADDSDLIQQARRLMIDHATAMESAQAQVAANASQIRAIRHLTEPVREQLASIAAQATAAVRASQLEAIELATNNLQAQLAPLAAQNAEAARTVERIVEQQRAALQEALKGVERTYLAEMVRAQQAELAAIQRQLDPFTRDWGSDEDSIYDDVE